MAKTYLVGGMTCGGCSRSVEAALKAAIPGATIQIDLASGKITIDGTYEDNTVAKVISDAGFTYKGLA